MASAEENSPTPDRIKTMGVPSVLTLAQIGRDLEKVRSMREKPMLKAAEERPAWVGKAKEWTKAWEGGLGAARMHSGLLSDPASLSQKIITSGMVGSTEIESLRSMLTGVSPKLMEGLVGDTGITQYAKQIASQRMDMSRRAVEATSSPTLDLLTKNFTSATRMAMGERAGLNPPTASSLAEMLRSRPLRYPAIHNPLLDPRPPAPRRGRPRKVRAEVVPVETRAPAPVLLPQEAGEAVIQGLVRSDRQSAKELLVVVDCDLALEHLEAIEECLFNDSRPKRTHAALSANLLLEDLVNRLYPARDGEWVSRFGRRYKLGAPHIKNRLLAYFDHVFCPTISTHEHKNFDATVDLLFRWTAEGHHVVMTARQTAESYRRLVWVLAAVARAYRASV